MNIFTNKDKEVLDILSDLPVLKEHLAPMGKPPNAFIYMDGEGKLCILPVGGGWLGCYPDDLTGDIAPFSD